MVPSPRWSSPISPAVSQYRHLLREIESRHSTIFGVGAGHGLGLRSAQEMVGDRRRQGGRANREEVEHLAVVSDGPYPQEADKQKFKSVALIAVGY
jgi:hypothetical protein